MANLGMFAHLKANLFNAYSTNPGKMLIHTGIIGWAMSSLAQICAIMFNDKIPKEQKMFMIPQEFADAVVNIASFYAVTRSFTAIGNKAVKIGKLLPKNVANYFKTTLASRIPKKNIAKKVGTAGFKVEKYLKQMPPKLRADYRDFKHGVDVVATIVGSIISCNVLTPLLRNVYASHRQKQNIAKMNAPQDPSKPQSRYTKYNPLAGKSIYSFTNRADLKI